MSGNLGCRHCTSVIAHKIGPGWYDRSRASSADAKMLRGGS